MEGPLLEFLRKSNVEGEIVQWLRRKWKAAQKAGGADSLEDFARTCACEGEKAVAAGCVSRLRDRFYGQWLALHCPFESLDEFLTEEIKGAVPDRYQLFAAALRRRPDYWEGDLAQLRTDMALEANGGDHIETVCNLVWAQRHLVGQYLRGELAREDVRDVDMDGDEGGQEVAPEPEDRVALSAAQRALARCIDVRVARSLEAREAADDDMVDSLQLEAFEKNRVLAALGPPGTGKTLVLNRCIRRWQARGARILFALPTGQLAAEMRRKHPNVDVDTCHGAFLFHKEISQALPLLSAYDLVVVDEVSMLTAEHFDRLFAMWQAADRLPCLVFLGDFWQLPGPQKPPSKVTDSLAWRNVVEINFSTVYRCEDPKLRRKLSALRTAVPSAKLLSKVADRAHRAWEGSEPDAWDVLSVLRRTDYKTTMVTCTRKGALLLNQLAAKVLFEDRHQAPLAELPLDWEADPANFDKEGEPVNDVEALATQIYKGIRIVLTKNLNKRQDFVNGMGAVVEAYDAASGCLTVETNTGKRLAICRIRERVGRRDVDFYPVRLGYASTVQKVQGQTLEHVTLWLDRACCRAAGYVALSRVRRDEDYLIAGNVTPLHFIPAM